MIQTVQIDTIDLLVGLHVFDKDEEWHINLHFGLPVFHNV